MASVPRVIDIDNPIELDDVVDAVRETNEPRILRRNGENVALVTPIRQTDDHGPGRVKTPEDYEAFLRSAGGWKGLIDADEFIKETYERRLINTRPPVEL